MTDSQKNFSIRFGLISLLLLGVYANTLNHQFVWDDLEIIVKNSFLESFANIPTFFLSADKIEHAVGYYRPLTCVSFAIDRAMWGLNPVGFNVTNLLLHIIVALVFYKVVVALFHRENLAFVATLIFSLHPMAGEVVNFHSGGRNTLLCACFALLSLLFYIKKNTLFSLLCFTLAIFSKEFGLLMPLAFLLYDRIVASEKRSWRVYFLALIPIACYFILRTIAVGKGNLFESANLLFGILYTPEAVVTYAKNMMFPWLLKTIYDKYYDISLLRFVIAVSACLGLAGVAILFRKKKELIFSIIWFLLFLLPVTNIVPLGVALTADRYAYFSLFGFSIALAYCVCLTDKWISVTVMVLISMFYITIDITRNNAWKDEVALFTQMTKDAPERNIGFRNLAGYYFQNKDYDNADKYLTLACGKKDADGKMLVSSSNMFREMKKYEKALHALSMMTELEPQNPQPLILMSRIYDEMGDKRTAEGYRQQAVALSPEIFDLLKRSAVSACRDGETLLSKRRLQEAERRFRESLSMEPDFVPALVGMGRIAAERGDSDESLKYLVQAKMLDPVNPAVHYNLSLVYRMQGKTAEAEEEMKKRLKLLRVER